MLLPSCQPLRAEVLDVSRQGGLREGEPDITHKVFLDIAVAPRSFKRASERTLGDASVLPLEEAQPLGRIVLGLYGRSAPSTVANFLRLVASGALADTTFSRVLPGEYIQAGQQGAHRLGQVDAEAADLQPNPDMLRSAAFLPRHLRPGTLSLSLGADNDEEPGVRARQGYRPTEFLITTGPGPVPRLDNSNLVFGRVLEGMATVASIAQVPTFKPSDRSKQINMFAQSIGDDRAAGVRRKYGKPLKAVIITSAGELPLDAPQGPPLTARVSRETASAAVA
ncbi:cyclophilin-like domain-containing protein [Haematococcus lacustris]